MKIEIIHTHNYGYILKYEQGDRDEQGKLMWVYEAHVGETEHQAFQQLLQSIVYLAGPMDSRHSPERISINVSPGDKYLDSTKSWEEVTLEDVDDISI